MDRDFYRQWKDHQVRSILGGAANGRLPTESDLAALDVPHATREQVRDLCADLKKRGDAGGFRARHRARAAADLISEQVVTDIPDTYAASVRVSTDTDFDGSAAAEAVLARAAGNHPEHSESVDQRLARRQRERSA